MTGREEEEGEEKKRLDLFLKHPRSSLEVQNVER
jgi:hypothetical protein